MIDDIDLKLIQTLQHGLAFISRPYALVGQQLDLTEEEVIKRLAILKQQGLIKRLGVIVNHRRVGYTANAMVVFDVPDNLVEQIGGHISQFSYVNLCYQRPRQGEHWSYNLYCMIHGKNREKVLQQLDYLVMSCGLTQFKKEVLFSRKCFKQRGAIYKDNSQQDNVLADG